MEYDTHPQEGVKSPEPLKDIGVLDGGGENIPIISYFSDIPKTLSSCTLLLGISIKTQIEMTERKISHDTAFYMYFCRTYLSRVLSEHYWTRMVEQ